MRNLLGLCAGHAQHHSNIEVGGEGGGQNHSNMEIGEGGEGRVRDSRKRAKVQLTVAATPHASIDAGLRVISTNRRVQVGTTTVCCC